jgi:hypothetical protein
LPLCPKKTRVRVESQPPATTQSKTEIAVKITNFKFVHCNPGIRSQAEAIKKSGTVFDFSKKKAAMEHIVEMREAEAVPPNTLRMLIRKHVPPNVPITTSHQFLNAIKCWHKPQSLMDG